MNGLPLSSPRVGAIVALASFMLAACGPDDAASVTSTAPSASRAGAAPAVPSPFLASPRSSPPSEQAGAAASVFNAPATPVVGAGTDNPAGNAAMLDAQASLAADSQQIPPVLHYAPGDDSH